MMLRRISRFAVLIVICVSSQAIHSCAFAQQDDAPLPKAEQVIERHILQSGGFEVLASISSSHTVWSKSDARGEWKFERWMVPGKKFSERSVNGSVDRTYGCWVADPLAGPKSLKGVGWWETKNGVHMTSGQELQEYLIHTASIDKATQWLTRHKEVLNKGVKKLDGEDCYLLRFTDFEGEVSKRYFSVKTGLHICTIKNEHHVGGDEVTRKYSDFREVDGIMVPMKEVITSRSGVDVWKVEKLEFGVEVEFDDFFIPDQVVADIDVMKTKLAAEAAELANSK